MNDRRALRIFRKIGLYRTLDNQEEFRLYRWAEKTNRKTMQRFLERSVKFRGKAFSYAINCLIRFDRSQGWTRNERSRNR